MKYRVQVHEVIEAPQDAEAPPTTPFLMEGQVVFSTDLEAKPNYEKLLAACRPPRKSPTPRATTKGREATGCR